MTKHSVFQYRGRAGEVGVCVCRGGGERKRGGGKREGGLVSRIVKVMISAAKDFSG